MIPAKEIDGELWVKASDHHQAIKEALAQTQEPVLLLQSHRAGFWCVDLTCNKCYSADFRFKHTTPPQRTWVGLTDDDVMEVWDKIKNGDWAIDFYDVIEAKLKEKNT